jgi:acetyltransferase-like isoleucine patch superfamily enzyme
VPGFLAARISQETPLSLFRAARKFLSARWSLRRATRVGKRVQLMGRLKVLNRKGTLVVGDRVRFHAHVAPSSLVVLEGGELLIGDRTFINYGADICATGRITIGEECRIGAYCNIIDNDFHQVDLEHRDEMPPSREVVLEPRVWLGNRVTILPGVRIGYGSVIAAGSVVTKSVPPMVVAGGVPARVIRAM